MYISMNTRLKAKPVAEAVEEERPEAQEVKKVMVRTVDQTTPVEQGREMAENHIRRQRTLKRRRGRGGYQKGPDTKRRKTYEESENKDIFEE